MISCYYQKQTSTPFSTIEKRLHTVLREQGFSVSLELDAQKILKDQLSLNVPACKIFRVCNSKFSIQASAVAPDLCMLLPCNVLIRTENKKTVVKAIRPTRLYQFIDTPALKPLASDMEKRLILAIGMATQRV